MRKLIRGIVEFRQKSLEHYRHKFSQLAHGQSPDTLMIACCDSRVAPNAFASTNPGDLFVVRNIGNLVCPCNTHDLSATDESTAAAIEFSLNTLNVKDIIICGHSECAAMQALIDDRQKVGSNYLQAWLRYADQSYKRYNEGFRINSHLSATNELSQINVLQQMAHLETYELVQKHLANGSVRIHGWWFDLATANVYYYDQHNGHFQLIDEANAQKLLTNLFHESKK